jgi:hypothetical protein
MAKYKALLFPSDTPLGFPAGKWIRRDDGIVCYFEALNEAERELWGAYC